MRNSSEETRKLLAHALRPFLLRRTKEQVATELPPKIEQTIYCELEAAAAQAVRRTARALPRLRCWARSSADGIGEIEDPGAGGAAAAAPGGLPSRPDRPQAAQDPSAKLDVLLEQLREVLDEGHKALVFSQFTSLLAIVRSSLDDRWRDVRVSGWHDARPAGSAWSGSRTIRIAGCF